jgi:peroxiredoxin
MIRLLLTILALATGASCALTAEKPDTVVGAKAPTPTLPGLDGKSVGFDSLRGKNATVVVFVSFDCPVSTSYMPELNELAKTHTGKGVTVILVCPTEDSRDTVAKAAGGFKLSIPVFLDPKKELAAGLKVRATPEAFLLDSDGVVRYRGRIDDSFSSRLKRNREVTTHDLQDALGAVMAGSRCRPRSRRRLAAPSRSRKLQHRKMPQ